MPKPLTELQTLVSEWAHAKGIFDSPNPLGQMAKTIEEIGEARLELRKYERMQNATIAAKFGNLWRQAMERRRRRVALELGDILVTLCIQAEMQGWQLSDCIPVDPPLTAECDTKREWENVGWFGSWLRGAICGESPYDIAVCLLSIYLCVKDAAATISHTPEQCLELAYEKIKGRTGHINEAGQFVKAECNFSDANAALATMVEATPESIAPRLSQAIQSLSQPTSDSRNALKQLGIENAKTS